MGWFRIRRRGGVRFPLDFGCSDDMNRMRLCGFCESMVIGARRTVGCVLRPGPTSWTTECWCHGQNFVKLVLCSDFFYRLVLCLKFIRRIPFFTNGSPGWMVRGHHHHDHQSRLPPTNPAPPTLHTTYIVHATADIRRKRPPTTP